MSQQKDQVTNNQDQAVDEPIVMPLEQAVEHTANTYWRLNEIKTRQVRLQRELIEAIKKDPELCALQKSIEMIDEQVAQLSSELELAKKQTKDSTLAQYQEGTKKTLFDGLLQVRKLSNQVLSWDESLAVEFALNAPKELQASLIKADKTGFKKFADVLKVPSEIIEIGDAYTVALKEDMLINFVTLSAIDERVSQDGDDQEQAVEIPVERKDAKKSVVLPTFVVNGIEQDTPF